MKIVFKYIVKCLLLVLFFITLYFPLYFIALDSISYNNRQWYEIIALSVSLFIFLIYYFSLKSRPDFMNITLRYSLLIFLTLVCAVLLPDHCYYKFAWYYKYFLTFINTSLILLLLATKSIRYLGIQTIILSFFSLYFCDCYEDLIGDPSVNPNIHYIRDYTDVLYLTSFLSISYLQVIGLKKYFLSQSLTS